MSALKEFATFITLNLANLAATYARLLAEQGHGYEAIPANNRVTSGRKLLKAVSEACELESSTPLCRLFAHQPLETGISRWPAAITPPAPFLEVECLGQTLTPIVTNLEAGKFLWQLLAETRAAVADLTGAPFTAPENSEREAGLTEIEFRFYKTTQDAVMILDQDGFIDCNQATLKLFGYRSFDQFIKTHPSEQSPPTQPDGQDSRRAANERIATAIRQGSNRFEWLHRRADGSVFPAEVLLTAIHVNGNPILQAVVRDITERKQAEDSLRESQARFAIAMEGSNEGLWDWNIPLNEVYFSPRWKSMIGYEDHELPNDFAEFESRLHPEDHDLVMASLAGYLEGRLAEFELEFRFRHKDGSYRWILARAALVRDDNGRPVRIAGSHMDITDRKQAAEKLARRAADLQAVAEISTAAATILETERLLQEVVDLAKARFGLYHTHIYLLKDPSPTPPFEGGGLELAAGAGSVGRQMAAEGWTIPLEREQSLVAQAARTRRGVIVNDVRQNPDFMPNPLLPDTRAELAVPMIVGDRVVGVLDVQSAEVGRFTAEDIHIQTTLAAQVAAALQTAAQYQQTQAALTRAETLAREQAVLNELGQALTARLSVDQVLEEAYRQTSRLIDAANFYIGLYDPEKEEITFRIDVSESVIDREIVVMPASEGIAGYIIRHHTAMLFEDNVGARQQELGITMVGQEARSWLGVPLMIGAEVLGVMAVQSYSTPRLYNEHDQEVLTAIANQVAIALQNARHFEETAATLVEVQESQQLLQTIIDATPDWIFIKDREHRYRLVNQGYANSLHLKPEDFIGKNDLELGFPEDIVKGNPEKGIRGFWADDREVMERGETKLVEVEPAVVDDRPVFLRTVKVPLADAAGAVWGVLGFVSNITNQQQLLLEVRQSQELLRSIIDATPDWIFIKDQEHRYRLVNQGYASALHMTPDEFIGKDDLELGFPEVLVKGDPAQGIRGFWADDRLVMDSGETQIYPNDPATIDGVVHVFHTIKTPLRDAAGQVWGVLAFARDVTDREKLLADLEKLTQVQVALSQATNEEEMLTAIVANLDPGRPDRLILQYLETDQDDQPTVAETVAVWDSGAIRPADPDLHQRYPVDQFSLSKFWLAEPNDILVVTDVATDPRLDDDLRALLTNLHIGAFINLPLRSGNRWQGLIALDWTEPRTFDEVEQLLFRWLLEPAAAVVARRRAYLAQTEALSVAENRLRETQVLQQLTQSLSGTVELAEIVRSFFWACQQLLGADYGVFSLVDQPAQRVKAVGGFNVSDDHLRRANHPLDSRDIMADIIRTGQTDIITGWDPRFDAENFEAEGMAGWGLRIFTPITVRQEHIGLVEVGFKEKVDVSVQESQVKLLRTLIDQTTIALESSQRFQASQKMAQRERTIREITDKMRAATSLEQLVKTTAAELGQRFSADYTLVELGVETGSASQSEQDNGHNL